MEKGRWIGKLGLWLMLLSVGVWNGNGEVEASSLLGNPYVTMSPDNRAFTLNYLEKNTVWYEKGKDNIKTGVTSSIRELQTGEHKYKTNRSGIIPIGEWRVEHPPAQCIHDLYQVEDYYHGITYRKERCYQSYFSGWMGYCADCKENVTPMLMYGSKAAISTLKYLDIMKEYFYVCPHCTNLEQGAEFGKHYCDAISWNKYLIRYSPNRGKGSMLDSTHFYNNATEYEGIPVTPQTTLSKNTYTRLGYEFVGWNTKPDGSGKSYREEEAVINLTPNNRETVYLYAQWVKSESTLEIDPSGGRYEGRTGISAYLGEYLSTYMIDQSKLAPPEGYRVSYVTNGGSYAPDEVQKKQFREWAQSASFQGKMEGNVYTYLGKQGSIDRLTAIYDGLSIMLPMTTKSGSSFGGWFYDAECTQPAGKPGDRITPGKNMTLYAKWVELVLAASDNYSANGRKGAVDLSWSQNDSKQKSYFLYQSRDGANWTKVATGTELSNALEAKKSFGKGMYTYRVPYAGQYTLTASGAQGGNSSNGQQGGLGGKTVGTLWLDKGEILTITVGGQDGYNGGGGSSYNGYGNGGGLTAITSDRKGWLAVAGGGGGATALGDGGAGGAAGIFVGGMNGQGGAAGGGGGNAGGSAGAVNMHYHSGNAASGGGCYGQEVICSGDSQSYLVSEGAYGGEYCGNCGEGPNAHFPGGPGCGSYSPHDWYYPDTYETRCNVCGVLYDSAGVSCTKVAGYTANCAYAEYPDGHVISSYPAYGGSNFIAAEQMVYAMDYLGQQWGDGSVLIESVSIGYQQAQKLDDVVATDFAAPDKVDKGRVGKKALSGTKVRVSWEKPDDNGSRYYHKAESYEIPSLNHLSTSNITVNTLTSGVMGYYYRLDGSPYTALTGTGDAYTQGTSLDIDLIADILYLHVATVDVAGNVSGTTHIVVGKKDTEVAWNLRTNKIGISTQESVYPASVPDTYYVRCDGETDFRLSYKANIQGNASTEYQITHSIFESQPDGLAMSQMDVYTARAPFGEGDIVTEAAGLKKTVSGTPLLMDSSYTVTTRSNWCKDLAIVQSFTFDPEGDGKKLRVTPIAGAEFGTDTVYSERSGDLPNSIYLIGDATPPEIDGLEALKNIEVIDRDESSYTLNFTANDSGSGTNTFFIIVNNLDNLSSQTYESEDGKHISLKVSEEDAVFTGDFMVELHAIDNVGNERIESHKIFEFTLRVSLERVLEPHDPIFRIGESGRLTIATTGYADRVEVIFPKEMTDLNPDLDTTYIYDLPTYVKKEELTFMIPLHTPIQNYQVTVRAYKKDSKLEDYPKFGTMDTGGNVLEDIRKHLK